MHCIDRPSILAHNHRNVSGGDYDDAEDDYGRGNNIDDDNGHDDDDDVDDVGDSNGHGHDDDDKMSPTGVSKAKGVCELDHRRSC